MKQETEYQVLSDVPGAADNLGPEHGLTGQQMQQWATSLSSAEVPEHVLQASLIYSPDLVDGLMRFKDLHHFGASQVYSPLHTLRARPMLS